MKYIFEESTSERIERVKGSKSATKAILRGGLLSIPFYIIFCFYQFKYGGAIKDIFFVGTVCSAFVIVFLLWAWIYRKCPRKIIISDKHFEIKSMVDGQKIKWKYIKELNIEDSKHLKNWGSPQQVVMNCIHKLKIICQFIMKLHHDGNFRLPECLSLTKYDLSLLV